MPSRSRLRYHAGSLLAIPESFGIFMNRDVLDNALCNFHGIIEIFSVKKIIDLIYNLHDKSNLPVVLRLSMSECARAASLRG